MTAPVGALSPATSDAIRVARVLALFLMSYVHVRPGAAVLTADAFDGAGDVVESVLFNVLSRGAVPLLSIVSAVLVHQTLNRKGVGDFIADKARTLLVPMVFWNAVMLAMVFAFYGATGDARLLPEGWLGHVNALFALTDRPINTPLAFLRDVFVCAALSPLILGVLKRSAPAGVALIAAAIAFLYAFDTPVLLREQIFVFFSMGLLLAHYRLTQYRVNALAALLMFLAAAVIVVGVDGGALPPGDFSTSVLNRLLVSVALWRFCLWLVDHAYVNLFYRIEPFIFLFFCTHWFVFFALGFVVTRLVDVQTSGPAIWVVLIEPVIGLLFAAALMRVVGALKSGWLHVLTGHRGGSRRLAN